MVLINKLKKQEKLKVNNIVRNTEKLVIHHLIEYLFYFENLLVYTNLKFIKVNSL